MSKIMRIARENAPIFLVAVATTALATVLVIYLTPLKHVNIIAPTMHEVDPAAAYKNMTSSPDGYLLVDVRGTTQYETAHAKGAISVPIASLSDASVRNQLSKSGKQIVLICGDGRLAKIAYGYLQNWGFRNLQHLIGGLENWRVEGLPVEP